MNQDNLAAGATASARIIARRLRAANALTVADYMAEANEKQAAEMEHLLSNIVVYEYAKDIEGDNA